MTSLFEKDILYLNCYKGQKGTNQMKCPYCNNPDTRVIDSRPAEDGSCIRRRRSVIKKDNTREQYDRRKVENGVVRACYKRPVATADIQKVVDRIETKVFSMEEKEIPSSAIGEAVMDELKILDEVAYVRFASVYREFKDVSTFMDELKKILK